MKYEYLKGSEKDFEGAPEWCTHVSESDSGLLAWEQADTTKKGNRYQWCDGSIIEGIYAGSGSPLDIIAERRPITEPSWDGIGLPPVGCECEGKQLAQLNWTKFKVVATDGGHVFGFWVDNVSAALDSSKWEFRPIRSEADKKREDAINKIQSHAHINLTPPISAGQAIALYDAIAAGKIPGVKLEG